MMAFIYVVILVIDIILVVIVTVAMFQVTQQFVNRQLDVATRRRGVAARAFVGVSAHVGLFQSIVVLLLFSLSWQCCKGASIAQS